MFIGYKMLLFSVLCNFRFD